ncbi:MAG: glycoside hydrolase family 3 protein [Elusimicrobia bacterium]|nr:glycoside hydrolase family 3 protein [Elusimicrobiota bacterium]
MTWLLLLAALLSSPVHADGAAARWEAAEAASHAAGTSARAAADRVAARRGARTQSEPLDALVASLSIDELIGQTLMVAIDDELADTFAPLLRSGKIGGGMLRWDKFDAAGARAFSAKVQAMAAESPRKIPLFLSIDHEGGAMFTQRTLGATIFPGNMALGATRNPALAARAAELSARELAALGIHITFGPSLDVNSNPQNPIIGVRSFGEDPAQVAAFGRAAIRGYLAGGILPVIKHFPGHGDTHVDSHHDLPAIEKSLEDLAKTELVPFRAAIEAGAPMVMPAHIGLPSLWGRDTSATLSEGAIRGLLRRDLGFNGVVVSDAMDMGAITKTMTVPDAAVLALNAGNDLLLLGKADPIAVHARLVAALGSGELTTQTLQAAVTRILKLKKERGISAATGAGPDPSEGEALARQIARESLTLLKNEGAVLPLKPGRKPFLFLPRHARFEKEAKDFAELLKAGLPDLDAMIVAHLPKAPDVDEALRRAAEADVLVLGSYQFGPPSATAAQAALLQRLLALRKPTVVISLMNPYDAQLFTDADAILCAYGMTPHALEAAARTILGSLKPQGRLPVSVPNAFAAGSGL